MSYYIKHIFICTNQRENNKQCCNQAGADTLCQYAKAQLKALTAGQNKKIRINSAGCMGRCAEGPVLVIYPDAVWYTYHSKADVDQIIQQHVLQNKIVSDLLLSDDKVIKLDV